MSDAKCINGLGYLRGREFYSNDPSDLAFDVWHLKAAQNNMATNGIPTNQGEHPWTITTANATRLMAGIALRESKIEPSIRMLGMWIYFGIFFIRNLYYICIRILFAAVLNILYIFRLIYDTSIINTKNTYYKRNMSNLNRNCFLENNFIAIPNRW